MSKLSDLEAALEAFMAAEDAYYGYDRSDIVLLARLLDEKMSTRSTLISRLLTGDTIRALLDVAEAAQRVRVEPRWCDSRLEDDYACEDCDGCDAEANYDRFRAALAPLVKEADHDRA